MLDLVFWGLLSWCTSRYINNAVDNKIISWVLFVSLVIIFPIISTLVLMAVGQVYFKNPSQMVGWFWLGWYSGLWQGYHTVVLKKLDRRLYKKLEETINTINKNKLNPVLELKKMILWVDKRAQIHIGFEEDVVRKKQHHFIYMDKIEGLNDLGGLSNLGMYKDLGSKHPSISSLVEDVLNELKGSK